MNLETIYIPRYSDVENESMLNMLIDNKFIIFESDTINYVYDIFGDIGIIDITTTWDDYIIEISILSDNIDMFKYAHESSCPFDQDEVLDIILDNDNKNILEYFYEHIYCANNNIYEISVGDTSADSFNENNITPIMDRDIVNIAIEHGNLELLDKDFSQYDDISCEDAIKNNDLVCLKYLCCKGHPIDSSIIETAISLNNLSCLKYLYENNYPMPKIVCNIAVIYGSLECLIYLRENKCSWNIFICEIAVELNRLDCLKYLHNNGFALWNDLCDTAVRFNNLECLMYLHESGLTLNDELCTIAISSNNLSCLIYLHENGCALNSDMCVIAATSGSLDCLIYLYDNDYHPDIYTCLLNTSDELCIEYLCRFLN